jgi:hypothetical protein
MIYFIAVTDRGYPEDDAHRPEVLMETDTAFTYSTRHLIAMFNYADIDERYSDNTGWELGYDKTWYRALGYYNGSFSHKTKKSKYADVVLKYMKDYLPQSK